MTSTLFFSPNTNRFLKRVDELDPARFGGREYRNHRCLLCAEGADLCLFRKNGIPIQLEKSSGCFNFQTSKKLFAWMEKKPKLMKKIKF